VLHIVRTALGCGALRDERLRAAAAKPTIVCRGRLERWEDTDEGMQVADEAMIMLRLLAAGQSSRRTRSAAGESVATSSTIRAIHSPSRPAAGA